MTDNAPSTFPRTQVAVELLAKLQRWADAHILQPAVTTARRLSSSSSSSGDTAAPATAPAARTIEPVECGGGNKQPDGGREAGERQPLLAFPRYVLCV